MPLFVPVLRSAMLFMNIYESYKTLKPPPPSTRDPTRPSVRAATQRKRDLKGCIAVWIIWCCFTIYEHLIEGFVNLFIPFYDEFKSMVMLFLILTRARGAEPIFLHVLRPLIRPYDDSIDGTLDVLRMTGDFLFALASLPVNLAVNWWHRRFSFGFQVPQSDTDSSSEASSSQLDGSEIRSASDQGADVAGIHSTPSNTIRFPQRASQPMPIRRTSEDSVQSSARTVVASGTSPHVEDHLTQRHHIWRPPRSAYDDDMQVARSSSQGSNSSASTGILELTKEEKEIEDWRKYPDFPSAYPSTPLTTTSHLGSLPPAYRYPSIPEDGPMTQPDFQWSLKSPRKPLNPGFTNLSDQSENPIGIHRYDGISGTSTTVVDTENDSISDDASYDEENSFNKTLRTPLQPYGSSRFRMLPLPLSTFPSQSTAVDSVDTTSSLQTRPLSDSGSGSISPGASLSGDSSPIEVDIDKTIISLKSAEAKVQRRRPDIPTRERPGIIFERRTRPRASPLKKRKVSRTHVPDGGTTTSETADEDGKETSSASQGEGDAEEPGKDTYVPGIEKVPQSKRPRVVGAMATFAVAPARKVTSTSTSRGAKARVSRRTSPARRSQQGRVQSAGTTSRGGQATSIRKSSRVIGPGSDLKHAAHFSAENDAGEDPGFPKRSEDEAHRTPFASSSTSETPSSLAPANREGPLTRT